MEADYCSSFACGQRVAFDFVYRFIDDILSFEDDVVPTEAQYGLECSETTTNPVVYLGIQLDVRHEELHLSVADKRDSFPWRVMKYPSAL